MIWINIVCFLLGAGIICLILFPKVKQKYKLDEQTKEENIKLKIELKALQDKKADLLEYLENAKQNEDNAAKIFYEKNLALMQERLDQAAEKAGEQYQNAEQDFQKEYSITMEECTAAFHNRIEIAKFELNEVQQKIEDLKKKIAALVEANKRAEELKNKSDFYKLNISDIDKQEIKKLREVEPYLRNSEPLNKVIWKCYYENPTTDLIGRVIGSGVHTGIYKITNLENQMCYIGQAVNIGR